jgi:hypothetical protein
MLKDSCFECKGKAEHRHHVVPRCLGGKKMISLCIECHNKIHSAGQILSLSRLNGGRKKGKMTINDVHKLLDLKGKVTCRQAGIIMNVSRTLVSKTWRGVSSSAINYKQLRSDMGIQTDFSKKYRKQNGEIFTI